VQSQAHSSDLQALDTQIRNTIEQLKNFKPILSCLRPTSIGYGMFIELGKATSGVIAAARKVIEPCFTCTNLV